MSLKFRRILLMFLLVVLASCVSKKEILYLQDVETQETTKIKYQSPVIQPNDILKISVETLIPEAAIPYNRLSAVTPTSPNIELVQLNGYLVSDDTTIMFPVLGKIDVTNMTTSKLEEHLETLLKDGHLVNPSVSIRLLNAKISILGQVNRPGTYSFTEQSITIFQALGYAGDLNINGKREDVIVIRESDGNRQIGHLNLTSSDIFNSPYYRIKPNDVVIVNPNSTKVKSAGFIGNSGTVLTIASLVLSSIILLTR